MWPLLSLPPCLQRDRSRPIAAWLRCGALGIFIFKSLVVRHTDRAKKLAKKKVAAEVRHLKTPVAKAAFVAKKNVKKTASVSAPAPPPDCRPLRRSHQAGHTARGATELEWSAAASLSHRRPRCR